MLPVFPVANEGTRGLGRGNFEVAITKSEKAIALHSIKVRPQIDPSRERTAALRAFLNKKEFNPFLKNCWLLMGKAQFMEGDFLNAASTFSYITRLYATEPEVVQEARIWLARCYSSEDWYYDAEDVIDKTLRDTLPSRLRAELAASQADLLLRQGNYNDALHHLQKAVKKAGNKTQKARLYYLLAQVQQQLGQNQDAYKSLSRVRHLNPPYRMALNAQILQTQVVTQPGLKKKEISKLRRMARSDKNASYLAQIYFAMGNLYMHGADTAQAVAAYEKGREKDNTTSIEKGVLLLRLGEIYWTKGKYDLAQTCYTEALSMIDRKQAGYEEISRRSQVLDKLVPYTSAIVLQDSLLALSEMSETDRNAAIDRTIAALVKREKEEERARRLAEAGDMGDIGGISISRPVNTFRATGAQTATWYFYNTQLVQQGKQEFRQRWGTRKNEDDWRRSNKTVVQLDDVAGIDYEREDSIMALSDSLRALENDSIGDGKFRPEDDPHDRAYYLAQIPFSVEDKALAHQTIQEALYEAGCIEKDQLEDFPLAQRTFDRLLTDYPDYEKIPDALYQLYLLNMRQGRESVAESYKKTMAQRYPENLLTLRINDPDFLWLGRYGKHIEDSLYTATYEAYRARNNQEVARNFALSTEKFPQGLNRPKFIFLNSLSRIGVVSNQEIIDELTELVKKYPKSDVSPLAGMIVNGLKDGRQVGTGTYDIGSMWTRRSEASVADMAGLKDEPRLLDERNVPFVFLAAYPQGDLDDNLLLYDFAHFNFTGFFVRHFEIEKVVGTSLPDKKVDKDSVQADKKQEETAVQVSRAPQLVQFRIHGFRSYDEAHAYAQRIYADSALSRQLAHTKTFLVSEQNLSLLGSRFSFADYQAFYDKAFTPIVPRVIRSLDDNITQANQNYEQELQPIYPRKVKDTSSDSILQALADSLLRVAEVEPQTESDILPISEEDDETYPMDEPVVKTNSPVEDIPDEPEQKNPLLPASGEEDGPSVPQTPEEEPQKPAEDTPTTKPATETPEDNIPIEEDDEDDDDGEWYPE